MPADTTHITGAGYVNLAEKFDPKVQERFKLASRTEASVGNEYSFVGVKTVQVPIIDVAEMNDYVRYGSNRYGTPKELGDALQELTISKDRSFTYTIDKGNAVQQYNIKNANRSLRRQIDEVVIPEIDTYRLGSWAAGKGLSAGNSIQSSYDGTLTKSNILEKIFTAGAKMNDEKVPAVGRTLYIPEMTFVKFRLADVVMGVDAIAKENIQNGYRGMIDGMRVVTVPSSIWPKVDNADVYNFIIHTKGATVDPMQLREYKIHDNPPGINGNLVEGRVIYDSFVLDTKAKAIFVSYVAEGATGAT